MIKCKYQERMKDEGKKDLDAIFHNSNACAEEEHRD